MKTLISLIIMAFPVVHAASQEWRHEVSDTLLTVEQCAEMALSNNAAVKNSIKNVESSSETRREAFTKYFPHVSASAAAFRTHNNVLEYDFFNLVSLGIIDRGKMASIQALQPVFMGGQIINGNRLAKVGEAVAELQCRQTADEVCLTARTYYWKLVTLHATRRTLEKALQTLDSLDRQVQVAVDAGIATRNDLLKVQLKRNQYRADMVDLDNGIGLFGSLLGQYIGLPVNLRPKVTPTVPDSLPEIPVDIFMPPSEALSQTVDYQLLDKNIEAKKLEKRIEVGKNLPTVALGAGWFYHDVLRQNHNFGAVMVAVNIPLSGWWGGSHAIRKKKLALEIAQTEFTDLSQKLEIGMQDKWNDLTAAHRKMAIAHEAIVQSAENLRLNRAYYDAGMCTVTDMLDAEALNRQAIDNYTASYGAFRIAVEEYLNATGQQDYNLTSEHKQ
ncbi:MAG TPA: TolC family protein [Muribaculaceae bacterium]|jgi:outer membrane protein TolC|nr:TolC family protein [Muribaculaceae bacterium]